MRQNLRWIGVSGAVAMAALGLWLGPRLSRSLAANHGEQPTAGTSVPAVAGKIQTVEAVKPVRATMSRYLDAPATVEAIEQADLYAKASGYLSAVRADIGDRVKQGDILAIIDIPEMARDLQEAEARRAAKAALLGVAETAALRAADAGVE